jgi:Kef-type K+ transport system membrane component KefB
MVIHIRGDLLIFFLDTGYHFWDTLIFREQIASLWKLNVLVLHLKNHISRRIKPPVTSRKMQVGLFVPPVVSRKRIASKYDKLSTAMSPFLQLAFELVVILLAAKAAGYLSTRLGQPSVLGELLAGVLLGPSLVNILGLRFINSTSLTGTISDLSELGVLLMMFIAGLELHLGELASHGKVSLLASSGGLLLSIGLGWGAGRLFGMNGTAALLLGLALGATSVSISARTLMELGVLRSRVGLGLLGAAVVDDILSILAFSIFLAIYSGGGGLASLAWIVVRMLAFLALAVAFGLWVLPRLAAWVERLSISQGGLAFAIVILLVYGLAAELVGQMAAIIGAFLAGLMFARTVEKRGIEQGITALAYGFFVPIFFINIGLTVNLRSLQAGDLWLMLAVTLAAVLGKLLGAAGGARLGSLPWYESIQLGAGMVSRGEVTLIIAAAGSRAGLINGGAFSAIITAVLLSILVTPPLLRFVFVRLKPGPPVQLTEAKDLPDK